jgi:predicted DNA-binding transcriptional regulator YafY
MDRTEKVHILHKLLIQSKYPVHISRIIEELKCSEKTFFRVRRRLEELYGAEIECLDENYYRYRIDDDGPHHFPGLWFSHKELEALICFNNALNDIHAGILNDIISPFKERLHKLLETYDISDQTWNSRIKCIPITQRAIDPEVLKIVTDSVLRNKRCKIIYKALSSDKEEKRNISPQTLLRYRDNWYIDAWCHSRNALRTFALSRIRQIEQTNEEAKIVDIQDLEQHYTTSYGIFSGKATETATIRFTGIAAREVSHEEWHPRQKQEWVDSETLQLSIPYYDATELIMDILRWGEMAEVVGPPTLRQKMKAIFKNCKKKYDSRKN